jgi:hypothetical protein
MAIFSILSTKKQFDMRDYKQLIAALSFFIGLSPSLNSQVIMQELSAGHRKTGFNHVLQKQFGTNDQYTFSNFAFFYKYHQEEDQVYDELGVQAALLRDIVGQLEGGVAFHHNSIIGLQKKLSLQYDIRSKPFLVKIRPSLVRVNDQWNQMVFINAVAEQPVTDNWQFFGQFRFQMFWGPDHHNLRSFERIRAGVTINGFLKVGLSLDYDQFKGPEQRETTDNYGIFVQKVF